MSLISQYTEAETTQTFEQRTKKAPPAILGENVYVAWWTNNTANNNNEVMFRASTYGGVTFEDKINLSNTTNADLNRAEIDGSLCLKSFIIICSVKVSYRHTGSLQGFKGTREARFLWS